MSSMTQAMPMRWILPLLLTLVAASPAQQPDDAAAAYDLTLTSPTADELVEYHSWNIGLGIELRAPSGDYEIEVRYAGTVHYVLCLAKASAALNDGRRRWITRDAYIDFVDGSEEVELRLLSLSDAGVGSSGRLLAESKSLLRFQTSSKQALEERVTELATRIARHGMSAAGTLEPREEWTMPSRDDDLDKAREKSLRWVKAQHEWLRGRVDVLSEVGETYAYAGQPGDALVALRMAEDLYEREAGRMLQRAPLAPHSILWDPERYVFAPPHLRRLGEFYARRMELERAAHYFKLEIDFYNDQRKSHPYLDERDRSKCWEQASHKMNELARLHYALRRDRGAHDLWTEKAKETWAKATPSTGGLLGESPR